MVETEVALVARQLGRKPQGAFSVVARCCYGKPQVIANQPLLKVQGEVHVFPTLYWLTCPYLKKAVGRLEGAGYIAQFQEKLRADRVFGQQLRLAHTQYAHARMAQLDPISVALLAERGDQLQVAMESGIAGSRGQEGIKCLHAHLAHFLAGGSNPIGEQVLRQLGGRSFCDAGVCFRD